MSRETEERITQQDKLREGECYRRTKNMLLRERKEYQDAGKQREWFERVCVDWLDTIYDGTVNLEKKMAYIDSLSEHIPEELTDEDYVELLLRIQNKYYLPVCTLLLTRDVLLRKLRLDRNSAKVRELLHWIVKQIEGSFRKGQAIQKETEESKTGLQMFAETIVLTGEASGEDPLSETEKDILMLAEQDLLRLCIQSGILVKEHAEEYIEYAWHRGNRRILPVLTALKFKE